MAGLLRGAVGEEARELNWVTLTCLVRVLWAKESTVVFLAGRQFISKLLLKA